MKLLPYLLVAAAVGVITCAAQGQQLATEGSKEAGKRVAQLNGQVQEHLRANQPRLAILDLREIVRIEPNNLNAHGNLGVLLYFQREYQSSVSELRTADKLQPGKWKIEALLGLAEEQIGDSSAGRQDMERAFLKIEDEKVLSEVGLTLANNYLRTGEMEKAASTLSALLDRQPTNKVALYQAYRVYADLADRSLLTLAMVAPDSAEVHLSMGRELARHQDDDGAIANYRKADEINSNLPGLHLELGRLLYNSSDAKIRVQAVEELKKAIATNPRDEQAYLLLGLAEQKAGDSAAARADLAKAVELAPNDSDACTELAKELITTGDTKTATELLERAVASDATNYVAHYRLAGLYRREGRKEEAAKEAESYQKYKRMSDSLQKIFERMRLANVTRVDGDDSETKP